MSEGVLESCGREPEGIRWETALLGTYTEDNETLVIDTCPEHTVDPLEMLYWWKAEDPGEFHMGSKEYWESAMQDTPIPPKEGKESGADLLTVKDFMPQPWSQLI